MLALKLNTGVNTQKSTVVFGFSNNSGLVTYFVAAEDILFGYIVTISAEVRRSSERKITPFKKVDFF